MEGAVLEFHGDGLHAERMTHDLCPDASDLFSSVALGETQRIHEVGHDIADDFGRVFCDLWIGNPTPFVKGLLSPSSIHSSIMVTWLGDELKREWLFSRVPSVYLNLGGLLFVMSSGLHFDPVPH